MEDCRCSVCKTETWNSDINPISGNMEFICEDCSDQLWEQVQETPVNED